MEKICCGADAADFLHIVLNLYNLLG